MTQVDLDKVARYFTPNESGDKGVLAVDYISLHIKSGESIALLGPSGCGKTTLLRLIAGLEQPTSGEVFYNDRPLLQIPTEERNIGMVFQDYALIPHWEAERTVGFFLRLRKRESEVPERVRRVSEITGVGIEHLMNRFPRQLSGGEKQRVAIARAFARDLDLLLLDEPFANLDAKFRAGARVALRRLLNEFPVTTVIVTHDQGEASSLADRIALIRDGHIEQIGSYDTLFHQPRNLFVAEFIGVPTINRFRGRTQAGVWQGEPFGDIPIPDGVPDNLAVTLGIRPDHLYLTPDGVPAVIEQVEMHLSERYQLLKLWSERSQTAWQIMVPLETPVKVGDTVTCGIHADQAHFFDALEGDRLA